MNEYNYNYLNFNDKLTSFRVNFYTKADKQFLPAASNPSIKILAGFPDDKESKTPFNLERNKPIVF